MLPPGSKFEILFRELTDVKMASLGSKQWTYDKTLLKKIKMGPSGPILVLYYFQILKVTFATKLFFAIK